MRFSSLVAAILFGCACVPFIAYSQTRDEAARDLSGRGITVSSTSLVTAIKKKNERDVRLLVIAGVDLTERLPSGATPLYVACTEGSKESAETLISLGGAVIKQGDNTLHAAAFCGLPDLVLKLLNSGTPVDVKTELGETPLHAAASVGNIPVAKLLLSRGANVDAADSRGHTALHMAASRNTEMVAFLIAMHASVNLQDDFGLTPLHTAANAGASKAAYESAKLLIAKGANLEMRDEDGKTPFLSALLIGGFPRNNDRMSRLLLDSGAVANVKMNDGFTALHLAASAGFAGIVSELIRAGADVNAKKGGWTPLSFALDRGHHDVAAILLANGGKQ